MNNAQMQIRKQMAGIMMIKKKKNSFFKTEVKLHNKTYTIHIGIDREFKKGELPLQCQIIPSFGDYAPNINFEISEPTNQLEGEK